VLPNSQALSLPVFKCMLQLIVYYIQRIHKKVVIIHLKNRFSIVST
jgi:hypothetical protein